jgi:hypothetical protein
LKPVLDVREPLVFAIAREREHIEFRAVTAGPADSPDLRARRKQMFDAEW